MNTFFLTGMFRSGSTTLARALNAHPEIACASDPYLEFFKVLRSDLASELGIDVPFKRPLGDYYFSDRNFELLEVIENASYDRSYSFVEWEVLKPILEKRCDIYSASLTPYLDNIIGSTYAEKLVSMLDQIKKCYGDKETKQTGFKEVWGNEFAPSFLENVPNSKVIIMQRDPRAVCASKNVKEEKYPWIFLCRQWRKLAALAWSYSQNPKYKDRIHLINYEDFVAQPEETTKKICDFLEVDWHPDIANPAKYKDGDGSDWKQNTSHGNGDAKFNTASLEKWKQTLEPKEIAYIEYLCSPEMELYSYEKASEYCFTDDELLNNSPRISDEFCANWMKGLIHNDSQWISDEMQKEIKRKNMLGQIIENIDTRTIKNAYIKADIFEELRKHKD